MRVTETYEPVKVQMVKAGKCPTCGKKVNRQRTFSQTINPFNRNEDGTIKTSSEVLAAVYAQAERWEPNFTHWRCG